MINLNMDSWPQLDNESEAYNALQQGYEYMGPQIVSMVAQSLTPIAVFCAIVLVLRRCYQMLGSVRSQD